MTPARTLTTITLAAALVAAGPLADPIWQDAGPGLAGGSGQAPTLSGTGSLQPGAPNTITAAGMPAAGLAHAFLGFRAAQLPFKGGILGPDPMFCFDLTLDGTGSWSDGFILTASLPSGSTAYLQIWCLDPGGPAGLAATNTLAVVAP